MPAGLSIQRPASGRWSFGPPIHAGQRTDPGQRWWKRLPAALLSEVKAGVLMLIALLGALLSWTAALAVAALTVVAIPILLMLGVVAVALVVKFVSVLLAAFGLL